MPCPPRPCAARRARVAGALLVAAGLALPGAAGAAAGRGGTTSPAGAVSTSGQVALSGVVESALSLEVSIVGAPAGPLELGALSTLAPLGDPTRRERAGTATLFRVPVELVLRQSGIACSTVFARLAALDGQPGSWSFAEDDVDAPPVPLDAAPTAVLEQREPRAIRRATLSLAIDDARPPGPFHSEIIFEAAPRCTTPTP